MNPLIAENAEDLEAKVIELMGLESPDLNFNIFTINEEERETYIFRHIIYNASPSKRIVRRDGELVHDDYVGDDAETRNYVQAHLLIPKNLKGKAPGILALHQHGGKWHIGKSEVTGETIIDKNTGKPLKEKDKDNNEVEVRLQADQVYGLELVNRGYVVLAPDSFGFEERQLNHPGSKNLWGERYLFGDELLNGRTLAGKNVSDNIHAIDVLTNLLSEVDPERIGCIGHSMGGIQTFYAAALDKRIKAAVSNCGISMITSLQENHICHTFSLYVPGLLANGIDTPEILSLVAPRAYLISATEDDGNFPRKGVEELYQLAQKYFSKGGDLRLNMVPGKHAFSKEARETAYEFLDRHLK